MLDVDIFGVGETLTQVVKSAIDILCSKSYKSDVQTYSYTCKLYCVHVHAQCTMYMYIHLASKELSKWMAWHGYDCHGYMYIYMYMYMQVSREGKLI